MSLAVPVCETLSIRVVGSAGVWEGYVYCLSIITHVVGSAGGVMILSARVGLDMRFVSYTCRWQCRRVSYGVPSPGWTTHPWTRVLVRKSCVPANNPPVGLSSPPVSDSLLQWSLARQRLTPFEDCTIPVLSSHNLSPNKGLAPSIQHSSPTDFNTTVYGMRWFEYCQSSALSPSFAAIVSNELRGSPPLISSTHPHINVPSKQSSTTL
ncbi:unnamed protein product [Prunus armeniaca]